jgi:hypothetical protein
MKKNIVWAIVYIMLIFALLACDTGKNSPIASSSSKAITAYSFSNPAAIGNININESDINESDKTISITVPYGTDISGLIATFTSTGASVMVDGTVQVSGITANDFTNPVIYTVTAGDGSTTQYTVTLTAALNSAKSLTSFTILGIPGTITESAKTITLSVPYGTDMTGLIATFTSTGASVMVDGTVQVSGITTNDFTNPVIYTVTAADSSTTHYTVTVSDGNPPSTNISLYKYAGSVQCNGGGLSLPEMERQLNDAGIQVIYSSCGTDGRGYFAVCGNGDGRIGIFVVPSSQEQAASAVGFRPLSNLPAASKIACSYPPWLFMK